MQEAKSMQKYDETALRGRCVTTLVADIHVVMVNGFKKVTPYRFILAISPKIDSLC